MQFIVRNVNAISLQNERNCYPYIQLKIFLSKCKINWNVRVPFMFLFSSFKRDSSKVHYTWTSGYAPLEAVEYL